MSSTDALVVVVFCPAKRCGRISLILGLPCLSVIITERSLRVFRIIHMTVSQLLAALAHLSEHGHAQDEVRVPVYEQGCMLGRRPSSGVGSVSQGIASDSGVVFLNTEDILVKF